KCRNFNYIENHRFHPLPLACLFALAGPAVKVFQRNIPELEVCGLEQGIEQASWLLCGASWQSSLEWDAIKLAKLRQIEVVAFLDHWVNYQERFERDGITHLPDQLWVADVDAEVVARSCMIFSGIPIKVVDNPYLQEVKLQIKALENSVKKKSDQAVILFVSENISGHALLKYGDKNFFGYTEFDALDLLLKNLPIASSKTVEKLIIRAHPSDGAGKYNDYQNTFPELIQISQKTTLLEDIFQADIVAGCESMALVVALAANKKVISCIPADIKIRLPHAQIQRL
ncbi:MAG: hypothetical protein IBX55_04585, partial [Methyloprofundus sp.]|nr:hypothetical protein [Methyloprofundus sp.]